MILRAYIGIVLGILVGVFLLSNVTYASCKTEVLTAPGEHFGGKQDFEALKRAKLGCKEHFPDAPCLKFLFKLGNGKYHAVCGKESK